MRLYANMQGQWVGTQIEAKKINARYVEVPTDKPNLIKFLNKLGQSFINTAMSEIDKAREIGKAEGHKLSRSATSASDLNQYDVHDVVLNCDRRHLGSALSAIINRLHDEVDEAQ